MREAPSLERHFEQRQAAVAVQKIDSGIEIQAQVVNAGGVFWQATLDWGLRQRGVLTAKEVGILQTCARMPRAIPSEAQSRVALQALAKLQEEGYTGELD